MDTQSGKRRIWVVEVEADDDAIGHPWRHSLGETEDDVEGHPWRYLKPEGDDTEGQGFRAEGLGQTEDGKDLIEIDSDEDVTGQGYRLGGLRRIEDDAEGLVKVKFLRPATDDDTKGRLIR